MMRQVLTLSRVQLQNLFGINELRYTKDKKKKAQQYGAAMLEIDLSDFQESPITSKKIREIVLQDEKNKKWIFYPLTKNYLAQAKNYYENKRGVSNGNQT